MKLKIAIFFIALAPSIVACTPVQHMAESAQPVGRVLRAGPGDVIVRVDKKRNLVNALGGSDIFGRTTNEGFSELYFGGLEQDGSITLYRQGTSILTDETTMSRSNLNQSFSSINGNATTSGNVTNFNATANTTTYRAPTAYHIAIPTGAMAIHLPAGTASLPFEGYNVEFLPTSPNALEYRVNAAQ